jgi:hypothetical protein
MTANVVIDCHMHIYPTKSLGREEKQTYEVWEYGHKPEVRLSKHDGDLDDALQAIRESGTSKAVAMSHLLVTIANLRQNTEPSARSTNQARDTEAKIAQMLNDSNVSICELARKHAELIPFVILDPYALSPDESEARLREMVANHDARGVKLHPVIQQFFPSDKRMWPTYRTCVELGIPILSHSGAARGSKQYAEPRAFVEVLREFPKLTLVLAHLGGAAWQQTLEVARKYQNAYFDCSEVIEWAGAPSAPTFRELAQLIKDVGPQRVMMGTDFPWYDLDRTIGLVKALPILSEEEKEGILGINATHILGI